MFGIMDTVVASAVEAMAVKVEELGASGVIVALIIDDERENWHPQLRIVGKAPSFRNLEVVWLEIADQIANEVYDENSGSGRMKQGHRYYANFAGGSHEQWKLVIKEGMRVLNPDQHR